VSRQTNVAVALTLAAVAVILIVRGEDSTADSRDLRSALVLAMEGVECRPR
jgi:hypothetical protein